MSRADIDSFRIYLDNLKQKYIQPLEEELEILESIAKGAQGAKSFDTYRSMISMVNGFKKDQLTVGTNILIGTLNVPDLWVFGIEEDSVPYIYSSDEVLVQDLKVNGRIRVGHFVLAALETLKVDLTDYVKNTDYANSAKAGVVLGDKTFGFQVNANGIPTCDVLSATEYTGKAVACFIGKGTLENAKNDIVKRAIVGNDITLTDEEKTSACDWIGALRKSTPSTGLARAYVVTAAGAQATYDIATTDGSTEPGRLVYLRGATSCGTVEPTATISVQTPIHPYAAANKKYVDDAVANAGGGGSADLSDYVKKSAFNSSYGMKISNGYVMLNAASESDITTGTNQYKGITPNRVDFLVKKGITANKLTLSDTEKASAQEWLGISGGLYKHIFYWEDEYGEACQLELFTTRSTRYDLSEDDATPWTQMLSETISAKIYFGGFEDEFSAVVNLYVTEGDSDNPEYDMVVGLDVYYYYYSNKRLLEVSNIMGQPEFSYTVKKA